MECIVSFERRSSLDAYRHTQGERRRQRVYGKKNNIVPFRFSRLGESRLLPASHKVELGVSCPLLYKLIDYLEHA
jgi:hypothetical protein